MTMRDSYLIQRLNPTHAGFGQLGLDNPFAFGGGLRNGGLSSEAMNLLRGVFSFDYMGAAEFEFGAVPKALQGLAADADSLTAETLHVQLAKVPRHWRDRTDSEPEGEAAIHVLCRQQHLEQVTDRIRSWATGTPARLKEPTHLTSVLRPEPGARYVPDTCGWLELDNGFFFFTDVEMWGRTCELFGVCADQAASVSNANPPTT